MKIKELLEERDRRVGFLAKHHEIQKQLDNYYELTYDAGVPRDLGYPQRTPRTARDWIEVGVNNHTLNNPKAIVPLRANNETARQQATRLEMFYGAFMRLYIQSFKQMAKKVLARGEALARVWVDDYYYGADWASMDQGQKDALHAEMFSRFPVKIIVPDPINCFPSPVHLDGNGFIPEDVIEEYLMTKAEVVSLCKRNHWRVPSKVNSMSSTEMVKWTSYYSKTQRIFLAEDEKVLDGPNILGFVPYVHVPSGYGNTSYEGKPEYYYRSILYGVKDMINLQTRALSQIDAILSGWAWPRPKIHGDMDKISKLYKNFSMDPNEPVLEDEGVDITFLQGQAPPPELFSHLGIVSSMAEPPKALQGMRATGVYSGEHQEALISYAKPIYRDPFKNLEQGIALLNGMAARTVEKVLGYPIAIRDVDNPSERGGRTIISPSDIDGYYYNEVKMLSELPETTDIRKMLGTRLHQAGIISHETCLMEYHDKTREEAREEIARVIAEKALENPTIQQAVAMDAADMLGLERAKKLMGQYGVELQRGGSRRMPETMPTGAESVRQRGRVTPGVEGAAVSPEEVETQQMGQE